MKDNSTATFPTTRELTLEVQTRTATSRSSEAKRAFYLQLHSEDRSPVIVVLVSLNRVPVRVGSTQETTSFDDYCVHCPFTATHLLINQSTT